MTTPTPTPPPAVGVTLETIADSVMVKIVGLIIFAGSGYFLYLELIASFKTPTSPLHTSHLLIFAIAALFGVCLAFTKATLAATGGLVRVVAPVLPPSVRARLTGQTPVVPDDETK